jgi:hypothetical protein
MSRVWVVSGFVLVGTGLALAGFGYWLSGNANCDASDLGRACVMASLGTSVVGASLAIGGWLRLKRLGAGDEGAQREGAGWAPMGALFAVLVGGLVLLALAAPIASLPVDVYGRPAPSPDAAPESFLPADLGGRPRAGLIVAPGEQAGSVVALATYAGEVTVRITRFNVTDAGGLANATSAADLYLDGLYAALDLSAGPGACASPGGAHWFTHNGAGRAQMAWQRENFVVQVAGPDAAARDGAARALAL